MLCNAGSSEHVSATFVRLLHLVHIHTRLQSHKLDETFAPAQINTFF